VLCWPRPIERFSEFSSSPVSGEERSNPHRIALGLARKEGRGDHFTGTTEAGSIGEVKHLPPLLLALLFTSWTAEARIGETAEESKKRYGEEQRLLLVQNTIDKHEVLLGDLRKSFNDPNYPVGLSDANERKETKELAVKYAQHERFRKIKDFYQELKTKGAFERGALVANNKETADFFGKRIVSFESLGNEIEKLDARLKAFSSRMMPPEHTYNGSDEFLRAVERGGELQREAIRNIAKTAEAIEEGEQFIEKLKKEEIELTETSKGKSEETLKFFKDGYFIACFLRNDKTYRIVYYRDEVTSDDVMRVLVNNSDEGVTWQSVVVKDPVVEDKNFLPLVVYYSSDQKLEGFFGKWGRNQTDLSEKKGVLIRERSSEVEPAIKKEEKGL